MRKEVTEILKTVTPNVFQDYPDKEKDFPCLIYSLKPVGELNHDGLSHFEVSLRVELYSVTSEERTELEFKLIKIMIAHGWQNTSNDELPHPDYYRQNMTFRSIK